MTARTSRPLNRGVIFHKQIQLLKKIVIMKLFQVVTILGFVGLIYGCGIHTLHTQMNLAGPDINKAPESSMTRVVFYNDSNLLGTGLDGSGKINIKIDGKALGSVNIREYAQVFLKPGSYEIYLAHYDIVTFEDTYNVNIDGDNVYFNIYSRPLSTYFEIVDELPANFTNKYEWFLDD